MSHQQFHHYHHQHQHQRQHQQLQQVQSESQLERSLESERNQQNQRSANSNANTERVSGLGSMDFRNLCQRLDVNGLRAKLPSLPSLPPLKLPKSLPKLRGRKIFRSSRRNNNSKDAAGAAATAKAVDVGGRCSLTLPQQSQQFINRTPQRISTISSLMYEEEQEMGTGMGMGMGRGQPSTYRSAGSLDDDYYAPESGHGERHSRPISPVKIPSPPAPAPAPAAAAAAGGSTLTQRLQRGYKSLSELRLKHLFAKQTTLRRDNIEVDRYVEQYEAELRSEQRAQARRDREIADNYDIRFKTLARSRQNTPDSDKQPPKPRSVAEQSGDESGMEETPPPLPTRSRKKPGIAATRFAKVRQPPLQMDEEEEETEAERQKRVEEKEAPPRRSSCKQLLQKLPSFPNSLPSLQRRSKGNEERAQRGEETPTQKSAIRQNIKRLRKSIKRPAKLKQKQPQKPADDSDEDQGQGQGQLQEQQQEEKKEPPLAKSTGNLRARLSRFASTEQLQERWRKSFKTAAQDSQESPKQAGAGAGAGAAAGAATGMAIGVHLERTLTKLNEKMHQLKFFQRQGAAASTSSCSAEAQPKPNTVGHEPVYIDDDEELAATYHHSDSDEDEDEDEEERGSQDSGQDVRAEEAFGQQEEEDDAEEEEEETQMEHPLSGASSAHAARQMATLAELQAATASAALAEESCPRGGRSFTAWSSESLEEIPDEDYPRVLIHQQHTDDSCESTLIIAVSTKPSSPAPPTPGQWLPNAEIISSFKEQQQQQPKEAESWPGPRSLYKPKSIDIFEGASGAAFADFDEALRNAPILRISAGSSCDTSGDEEADDSSSRVTRIRMQTDPPPQIGNSRESLMAQELEEEEDQEEQDEEEEDSAKEDSDECALERPPSASPPPPPLPQRRPLQRKTSPPTQAAPIYDAVPPPLPTSKPPPLSMTPAAAVAAATPPPAAAVLPQRSSASMSRPAKPLVKTSSLRLTYNEQVHPGDIGKVNKLISRFEGGRRPRLCPRRLHSEEYELHATSSSFSGEEEEEQDDDDAEEDEAASPITPTNRPVVVIPEIVTTQPSISINNNNGRRKAESLSLSLDQSLDRQNSNCSRSEYGSPLSYPYASQRRSSTPTGAPLAPPSSSQLSTPHQQMLQQQQQQRQQARRSRRSMTRDDENFYSFDSDEENSYYSISPSGSSRYVVEI